MPFLNSVGEALNILRCGQLVAISPNFLGNLTSVGGVAIKYNSKLSRLHSGFLGNVTTILGNVSVIFNPELTIIDGFNKIVTVNGGIEIESNPAITLIQGFKNLTEVGGAFALRNNSFLVDVAGLTALQYVNGTLNIFNNTQLASLQFLSHLMLVAGSSLNIQHNAALYFLGLNSLRHVFNNLTIKDNANLTSLEAQFAHLTMVGQMLQIVDCSNLENLKNSFPELTSVQSIDISYNQGLRFFPNSAFSKVRAILSDLTVSFNPNLQLITAFYQVENVHGAVKIVENQKLTSIEGPANIARIGSCLNVSGNVNLAFSPWRLLAVPGVCDASNISVFLMKNSIPNFFRSSTFPNLQCSGGAFVPASYAPLDVVSPCPSCNDGRSCMFASPNGSNTCSGQDTSFKCTCAPGYSGKACAVPPIGNNDCAGSLAMYFGAPLCRNGGQCADGVDAFTCACLPGFSGPNCDRVDLPCDVSPCLHNGTCVNYPGINETFKANYSCVCPANYQGFNCGIDKDECALKLHNCPRGALCNNTFGSYVCACPLNVSVAVLRNASCSVSRSSDAGSADTTPIIIGVVGCAMVALVVGCIAFYVWTQRRRQFDPANSVLREVGLLMLDKCEQKFTLAFSSHFSLADLSASKKAFAALQGELA